MIINILAFIFCCFNPVTIAGAITAGIGIGKVRTDIRTANKLVIWGWSLLAVAIITSIAFLFVLGASGAFDDSDTAGSGSL